MYVGIESPIKIIFKELIMINTITKKLAIILLIAVFSAAGMISCGGVEDIAGSRGGGYTEPIEGPDEPIDEPEGPAENNWDPSETWNIDQTKGLSFYGSSGRGVYLRGANPTPWRGGVSYNDTDRLTRMWKFTIDGGIRDGKRRKYIKSQDGDFFFDENYNIRWSKQPDVVMKWFQGGAIVQLSEGYGDNEFSSIEEQRDSVRFSGSWTIGGLYTYAMSLSEANRFNSDSVNAFFGSETGLVRKNNNSLYLYGGRMEILVLHPGYPLDKGTGKYKGLWAGSRPGQGWTGEAWAAQSYMAYNPHSGYMDGNGNGLYNIKGNSPERYQPHLSTYQIYHLYFRWVVDEVYDPNNFGGLIYGDSENRIQRTRVDLTTRKF